MYWFNYFLLHNYAILLISNDSTLYQSWVKISKYRKFKFVAYAQRMFIIENHMKMPIHQEFDVNVLVGAESSIFHFMEDNAHLVQIKILFINIMDRKVFSIIFLNL